MRKIKVTFLAILCIGLSIPLLNFNFESEYASPIDNRMLTEWDLYTDDISGMIDNYIKDRIGYRTEAIDTYTEINDKLFDIMLHPTYTYGKDGYVFMQVGWEFGDQKFIDAFCTYLKKVQDYCEARNVPFIYCLNPSKGTIYSQYLPEGYIYKNQFNKLMYKYLEEHGVNYITNEYILKEKSELNQVYNVKYDAGHWNDFGAFYGSNNLLKKISEYFPEVKERSLDDFEIGMEVMTSLPVSHFEIEEEVPVFKDKNEKNINNITDKYQGVKMNQNYPLMAHFENHAKNTESLPKVLMFQGSYYNSRYQFLQSSFEEYHAIHNYENFLEFDYYFNIFQPECVILETAEYATRPSYFSFESMVKKNLNPVLDEEKVGQARMLEEFIFEKSEEGNLVTITMDMPENVGIGYLLMDGKQFDFSMDFENQKASCTVDKKYMKISDAKVYFE